VRSANPFGCADDPGRRRRIQPDASERVQLRFHRSSPERSARRRFGPLAGYVIASLVLPYDLAGLCDTAEVPA